MPSDDNRIKSISKLVRSLVAVTVSVVVFAIALVYYLYSSQVVHIADQPKRFVCGTCEDSKKSREKNLITYGVDGKALFKANCSTCHSIPDNTGCGPGLKGILGRIPGGEWKYLFVRDHDSVIASGDPYAVALAASYNYPYKCPRFPQLTDNQIDAILAYCDASW